MTGFRDRVAVVTGAASGLGRAICWELGRAGARLALIDFNGLALLGLHDELCLAGIRCAPAVVDVGDRAALASAIGGLADQLGAADLLFPCAGICGFDLVDGLDVDQIEKIMRVNYLGVVYAVEAVLPAMLQRGSGQIVAVSSLAGVRGIPFEAGYGASKAALASFLESLRPPLRRRGVLVTLAFPGFLQTPLLEDLIQRGMTRPPLIVTPEAAARTILDAALRGRRSVSFPFVLSALVAFAPLVPSFLYDAIMSRLAKQVSLPH